MRNVITSTDVCVFDDVLPAAQFEELWRLMNALPYRSTAADEWLSVWNLHDGHILRAKQLVMDARGEPKTQTVVDALIQIVLTQARELASLSTLKQLAIIPYVWPAGTSISWHSDGENEMGRLGAFTYYATKTWNAEWGGELMVSRERGTQAATPFDNTEVSELVLSHGVGTWIAPKPNRLVFTMNGILHKVNKTSAAAAPRLSIQGFLLG